MKKAQLSYESTYRILIFLFVLFVLLVFSKGLLSILDKLLGFGFKPPASAEAPTLALRCAIDSVAYGSVNDYTCVKGIHIRSDVSYAPIHDYKEAVEYITGAKEIKQTKYSQLFNPIVALFIAPKKENNYVGYAFGYTDKKSGYQNITITVCGDKNMFKDVDKKITDKYFKYLAESNEFRCMVYNFNLPQVNKPIGVGNALVPNFGDPDFIIYYEKFPEGEEKAWLDVEDSWGTVAIIIGGLVAAIPYAGGLVRRALADSASEAFRMLKTSLTFWRGAVREGTVSGLRDALTFEVKNYGVVLTRDEAESISKDIMKGKLDDAVNTLVSKGMSKESAEDIVYEWSWLRGLSDEEVTLAYKFEREFTDFLVGSSGRYFDLESKTFNDFMSAWKQLPDDTVDKMNYKAKLFGKFVKGEPVTINGKTYQLSTEEVKQIRKFIQNNANKLVKTYGRYYKRLPPNARLLYERRVDDAIRNYLKNSRSMRLMIIEGLGYAGFFNPISPGKVDVDGDGIKDDVFLENVAKCLAVVPSKGLASAIAGKGVCTIISAMGFAAIWIESKTYYKPVGINSLGLYYPLVWFFYGKSVEYPLIKEAMPYYVYLGRTFDPTRLYLASPCNAILFVEKTKMKCIVPRCDALGKFWDMYFKSGYGSIYPYATDYFGCRSSKGKCTAPDNPKDADDIGFCYCIKESVNPCYNQKKCDEWIENYLGCHKFKDNVYTPFAIYTVNENGVSSKFLVGGVDYKKVKELTPDVRGYKVCPPPAWYDPGWFSVQYEVNAIKVTPALANVEPNYCYWGKGDMSYVIQKIGNNALFFAIDMIVGETPLVILSGMAYVYTDEKIDESYRWWNHPDELIPDWLAAVVPPLQLFKLTGM